MTTLETHRKTKFYIEHIWRQSFFDLPLLEKRSGHYPKENPTLYSTSFVIMHESEGKKRVLWVVLETNATYTRMRLRRIGEKDLCATTYPAYTILHAEKGLTQSIALFLNHALFEYQDMDIPP